MGDQAGLQEYSWLLNRRISTVYKNPDSNRGCVTMLKIQKEIRMNGLRITHRATAAVHEQVRGCKMVPRVLFRLD